MSELTKVDAAEKRVDEVESQWTNLKTRIAEMKSHSDVSKRDAVMLRKDAEQLGVEVQSLMGDGSVSTGELGRLRDSIEKETAAHRLPLIDLEHQKASLRDTFDAMKHSGLDDADDGELATRLNELDAAHKLLHGIATQERTMYAKCLEANDRIIELSNRLLNVQAELRAKQVGIQEDAISNVHRDATQVGRVESSIAALKLRRQAVSREMRLLAYEAKSFKDLLPADVVEEMYESNALGGRQYRRELKDFDE